MFFFNDTATTEIYPLSLHDALPICAGGEDVHRPDHVVLVGKPRGRRERVDDHPRVDHRVDLRGADDPLRSEEHTPELQSRQYLVCRLLLEKKIRNDAGMWLTDPSFK